MINSVTRSDYCPVKIAVGFVLSISQDENESKSEVGWLRQALHNTTAMSKLQAVKLRKKECQEYCTITSTILDVNARGNSNE